MKSQILKKKHKNWRICICKYEFIFFYFRFLKTKSKQKEILEERKKKGKKIDEKIEEEIKNRGDIVETSWKHHKELRFLEKSTGKGKYHSNNFKRYTSATNENVPDSLPDIDDPKFEILRINDNLLVFSTFIF